jgi:exodeoxyribonuclease X
MTAIIFDTETTAVDQPRLIEAAWLKFSFPNDRTPQEQFQQRYHPGKPISLGALAQHHILDEELVDCPPYDAFRLPTGVEYLVGYHVDYDWKVIGQPDIKRICVMALARYCFPGLDSYAQSAVLYHVARPRAREWLQNAHSALQDVYNCARILRHVLRSLPAPASANWEAVWRSSEQARIPIVMPFGRHKGKPMLDVPADYKRWLLGQPDLDPYLVMALRGAPLGDSRLCRGGAPQTSTRMEVA